MKVKLIAIAVLTMLLCAMVPMTAMAASTATVLTIDQPITALTTQPFDVTGKLIGGSTSTGQTDRWVTVFQSSDGRKWTAIGTDKTDGAGIYTVSVSKPTAGTYYYKATFAGDRILKKATSSMLAVSVNTPPKAIFTADTTSGQAPLTVEFTDQSTGTGPLTYAWDFGDGQTSTDKSPSHQYTAGGTYTVALTVTGPGGTDTATKTNYISVVAVTISASLYATYPDENSALYRLTAVVTGATGPFSYDWKVYRPDGTLADSLYPASPTNYDADFTNTIGYYVVVTVRDANGNSLASSQPWYQPLTPQF